MDQCGRCHATEAETFFDTFHGKASRLGSAGAAKCYDCHGTHEILPPSNPASTLGRDNVVETCAQCHEGAHRQFAGYLTHATHHDADTYPWLFWSFWAMTTLLIGTLAFALLHTLFWLVRLWLSRDEWKKHKEAAAARKGQKLYRRFTRFQRVLHMVMMLSFFMLALTGMALKFSYMGWAQFISRTLGGSEAMGVRHRMGAIALIIVFAMHLANVVRKKREAGKSWKQMLTGPETIMFRKQDLKDLQASVFVIGMTGLILWFPELFTRIVPGWFVNVATIIHSDEALLAVGFIFTVHFFNTHFRPDKFPMDTVMFTGRVTLDELKYDKPGEYERLASAGTLEAQLVDPFPRVYERSFRIFGFVMLGIGLTLIGMIVYAMLFGYR
ncbi:MAG: cytochrome b/b6 domain-containing protein [Planctomycetota bacterium]